MDAGLPADMSYGVPGWTLNKTNGPAVYPDFGRVDYTMASPEWPFQYHRISTQEAEHRKEFCSGIILGVAAAAAIAATQELMNGLRHPVKAERIDGESRPDPIAKSTGVEPEPAALRLPQMSSTESGTALLARRVRECRARQGRLPDADSASDGGDLDS
jgi:hypothetical protein